jgi:hypothetical protein
VDVAGLADLATPTIPFVTSGDGNGIKEIGSYVFADSNTWSFKTNAIAKDGSLFGFGNDLGRGFDVYRFEGLGRTVPPLVPNELRTSGAGAPGAAPGSGSAPVPAQQPNNAAPSGQAPSEPSQASAAMLPTTGGSGPAGGVLLLLTALTAGVAAVARRSGRPVGATG